MTTLRDKASYLFIPSLGAIKILKDVVTRTIPKYSWVGDPVLHINKYEASLLGMTFDDDHIALLFSSTLSGITTSSFFRLPPISVSSWENLKLKFIQKRIDKRQLLQTWSPWMT